MYSPRFGRVLLIPLALALAFSCADDDGGNSDSGNGDGGNGDGGNGSCAATLADLSGLTATKHRGTIDADTAWTAAASPHVIEAATSVSNATLTIEPCAVVLLDAGVHLTAAAGGKISALGTPNSPIIFASHGSERWDYLLAHEDGAVSLAYVTFSGGGADRTTYDGATLVADGPTSRPYVRNLEVQHVTITDSAGYGVLMRRHSAFVSGSTDLVIRGAGADDPSHPSPLRIDGQALTSVPNGTYTGNTADRIEVDPFVAIEEDATIVDHGVPYWISNYTKLSVARKFGDTGSVPQLSVEAGVTLAFEEGGNGGFRIGGSSKPPQPGSLTINGTSAAPVTLTSAAVSPGAGDWEGLVFEPGAGAAGSAQSVKHAIIEYGGRDPAIKGYACYSEDGSGSVLEESGALVIFGWAPTSSFLKNSTLRHSLGWGVFRGWNTTQGGDVDFTATNTFLDLVACEQNDIKDTCPGAGSAVVSDCAGTL